MPQPKFTLNQAVSLKRGGNGIITDIQTYADDKFLYFIGFRDGQVLTYQEDELTEYEELKGGTYATP